MKRVYNVSYDLKKAGKDYKGLHEELKKTLNWNHLLGSTWLLSTTESATQIWERLKPHIDGDDRILIIQVINNANGWLDNSDCIWLNNQLAQLVS